MRFIFLFIIFLFISCRNENHPIFFGGKILNKSADKIILNKDDHILNESSIDENGFFQMKLDSISSGLYNFFLQPEFQYIILEKNVVPEFLFENCTALSIENSAKELLSSIPLQNKQKDLFKKAIRLLSTKEQRPSEKAAKISLKFLNEEILKI